MRHIKLDAIPSTNDFLRDLAKTQDLNSFTVVSANSQTHGKGQMGMKWISDPGKNLTFSVYLALDRTPSTLFLVNAVVAYSVVEVLNHLEIPNLSIKWPNDILAGKKKMGGILIENVIKADGSIGCVIGIGLNVNQEEFGDLAQAGSLYTVTGKYFDRDYILNQIIEALQLGLQDLQDEDSIWENYHSRLFRRNELCVFQSPDGRRFNGIIHKVDRNGKLRVELEDDSMVSYGIKEIQMLY